MHVACVHTILAVLYFNSQKQKKKKFCLLQKPYFALACWQRCSKSISRTSNLQLASYKVSLCWMKYWVLNGLYLLQLVLWCVKDKWPRASESDDCDLTKTLPLPYVLLTHWFHTAIHLNAWKHPCTQWAFVEASQVIVESIAFIFLMHVLINIRSIGQFLVTET